jgi:thymidylate synthase
MHRGDVKESRAGNVMSVSHVTWSHDMREGFPAITGRKLAFKTMAAELECFVKGLSRIYEFQSRGCHIWDANLADFNARTGRPDNKDLGPIYGVLWRGLTDKAPSIPDQLVELLAEAKANPQSRRLLVTAWAPGVSNDASLVALPPCHLLWQISIVGPWLDLCFYMRSVDLALGLPFDIASYALLQSLIAHELGYKPRTLTAFLADAHIYTQNLPGVTEYLTRNVFTLPTLNLGTAPGSKVIDFSYKDVSLSGYTCGDAIKMDMAV